MVFLTVVFPVILNRDSFFSEGVAMTSKHNLTLSSFDQGDSKTLAVNRVYHGFATVNAYEVAHKKFDGTWTPPLKRELFESGDAVVVLPYDPIRDEVVLVEQFRISAHARGIKPWLAECIAGRVDEGETPEQVAIREAHEEAGCVISDLQYIGAMFLSPGIIAEYATFYVARTDAAKVSGVHGLDSEDEDIRAFAVDYTDAQQALTDGRLLVSPAFICLQWLALHRDRLREQWTGAA